MIAAYHLIWSAYGWWLPNDPRGSGSQSIREDILRELGELHLGRKKIQPAGREIRAFYARAKDLLYHELSTFTDAEISLLAECFANTVNKHRYTCYACAIMPDHVHLAIRKHRHWAEEMIERFQNESRPVLQAARHKPIHPIWGGPGWKVFLDTEDDIRRTIVYVENNPIKARRPAQRWPFVTVYDGWLPGGRMRRKG